MRNLEQELKRVSDIDFFTKFLIANDLFSLIENFENDELFKNVCSEKDQEKINGFISLIIRQLRSFEELTIDPNYANPMDASSAYLLWLLSKLDLGLARCFCSLVLGMQNIWWAKKVANKVSEATAVITDDQEEDAEESEEVEDEIALPARINYGGFNSYLLSRDVFKQGLKISMFDDDTDKVTGASAGSENAWIRQKNEGEIPNFKNYSIGV